MNKVYGLIATIVFGAATMMAQTQSDPFANGLAAVADVAGEAKTPGDAIIPVAEAEEVPLWKQKLYYGYNFDIYFHHDSR